MDRKILNQKLDVFISSKINPRYTLIRKALGALLYESELVNTVYVFEEEGATSDSVKSAYLKEVALSNLCIFLIDNKDGHSDNVYAEHKMARDKGINRLYFFCNEKKKKATPLQSELLQLGTNTYVVVARFSELPYIAYQCAIQDIINRYRRDAILQTDDELNTKSNSTSLSMSFDKIIYTRFSINHHLSSILYPFLHYASDGKSEPKDDIEEKSAIFLSTVLGITLFCKASYIELKQLLLKDSSLIPATFLEHRLNAIYNYFNGNLEECYISLEEASKYAESSPAIPEWVRNDIAIDMRNVAARIDEVSNRISISSEGQRIIDNSTEHVFYPLLDRFDTNQKDVIIKEYFESITESPYSTRYHNAMYGFVDIASCFNVALRFGSLTQIIATQERYLSTLFSIYNSSKEASFLVPLIKTYILRQERSSLKKVINTYPYAIERLSSEDIDTLIVAVSCEPIEHLRAVSHFLLIEYCGYYMSDLQFEQQTNWFFTAADTWCENETRIKNHGFDIIKTAQSIVQRCGAKAVLALLFQFVNNGLWQFIDEIIEAIGHFSTLVRTTQDEKALISIMILILDSNKARQTLALDRVVLSIRQTMSSDVNILDEAVQRNMPDYFVEYSAYVAKNYQMTIKMNIKAAQSRNQKDNANLLFSMYASNPYSSITGIIAESNVPYNKLPIKELIEVIQITIRGDTQQHDLKEGAIKLATLLLLKYPSKAWGKFVSAILTYGTQQPNHRSRAVVDQSLPNLLSFNYLLFKIAAHKCSYSDCLIGFAEIANRNQRDQIEAIRGICLFLNNYRFDESDSQISGAILIFVLSFIKASHSHAQRYAIHSLLSFTRHSEYHGLALERLAYWFDHTTSPNKATILRGVKSNNVSATALGAYILQKGRTDTNYCIRIIADEIEKSRSVTK